MTVAPTSLRGWGFRKHICLVCSVMRDGEKSGLAIAACALLVGFVAGRVTSTSKGPVPQALASSPDRDEGDGQAVRGPQVYYANCSEARAAGVTPIYAGEPGYAPHLDRDRDGIACE